MRIIHVVEKKATDSKRRGDPHLHSVYGKAMRKRSPQNGTESGHIQIGKKRKIRKGSAGK